MEDKPSPHSAPRSTECGPQFGDESARALGLKWTALHDAAATIATIASIEPALPSAQIRNFPAAIRDAGGWRRISAAQGIEDLTAILEPGLKALLEALAQGVDPAAPARALYGEFEAARDALLLLAGPSDEAASEQRE